MGFNMKYEIKKQYLTGPSKRRPMIEVPYVGFLVAHDTGNPGSTAEGNVGYYERSRNEQLASAQIFSDDKNIVECIPFLTGKPEKAFHVRYNCDADNRMYGDDANDIALGVEMCWGPGIDSVESYKRFVWVLAYACYKFKLDPTKTIVGHDVLDPGRKIDPTNGLKYMGKTSADLLRDVVKEYNDCLGKTVVQPAPSITGKTYTIQAGDTFWNIAQRLTGISSQDLIAWNPTVDAADLKVGQVISLGKPEQPKKTAPELPKAPTRKEVYYTIKKGDTFWDISKAKKVSVENLKKWNPKVDVDDLKVGSKIIIGYENIQEAKPAPKPKPAPAKPKWDLPTGTFKRGSKGSAVLAIQKALCAVKFYPERGTKDDGCDGSYGPKTENAIMRFESVYVRDNSDGVYDSKTEAALEKLLNK